MSSYVFQGVVCRLRVFGDLEAVAVRHAPRVELLLQELGCAFIPQGHLAVDLGQGVSSGFGREPFAQTGTALTRGHRMESAPGGLIKSGKVKGLGR